MEFYQKLQKLRKENGMSQEDLANHLNVSRQAVSKWENGQGYPETEKLLQISSLYNVSVDYLLKEEPAATEGEPDDGSFYASREMVESFLQHKWQGAKQITLGVAILILSIIWLFLFSEGIGVVLFFLQAAVGVVVLVACGFRAQRYDERMDTAPLVFDQNFLREFRVGYQAERKRAGTLIVSGIFCVLLAIVFILLLNFVTLGETGELRMMSVFFIFIACGVSLILLGAMRLSAHGIIAENHKHMEELREEGRGGWVFGSIMLLATALFLLSVFSMPEDAAYKTMTLIGTQNVPAWAVFPVAAILATVVYNVVNAIRKK